MHAQIHFKFKTSIGNLAPRYKIVQLIMFRSNKGYFKYMKPEVRKNLKMDDNFCKYLKQKKKTDFQNSYWDFPSNE